MTSPLVDSDGIVSLRVAVEGVELPEEYQVLQVRVQLGLRSVGRCTLTFVDENYAVVASGKLNIGKAVSVSAGYGDLLGTVFDGTVTSVASEVDGYRGATLTVTVQDLGYELLRDTEMTVREIAALTGAAPRQGARLDVARGCCAGTRSARGQRSRRQYPRPR